MTQPTPYTRQYNFNDYQTTNPNSPLPGAQVDAEFNAVKLTSDQTRQNLGQIQRDDGKLANQSVHKDAFDRDALAMLGWIRSIREGIGRPRLCMRPTTW